LRDPQPSRYPSSDIAYACCFSSAFPGKRDQGSFVISDVLMAASWHWILP
jgi:hypothetical protein